MTQPITETKNNDSFIYFYFKKSNFKIEPKYIIKLCKVFYFIIEINKSL
jgi:hypothetical protein